MATTPKLDAVALLKADHRKVEDLFAKFEKTKAADRKQRLAKEICTELTVHTLIEEEIFYPACRGEIKDETVSEAYVEHDGAKMLIAELEAGSPEDDFYDAKMKVLSEEIKHHVKEEEMRSEGMFAQAKAAEKIVVLAGALVTADDGFRRLLNIGLDHRRALFCRFEKHFLAFDNAVQQLVHNRIGSRIWGLGDDRKQEQSSSQKSLHEINSSICELE